MFTAPTLALRDWAGFLKVLFPEVQRLYSQSAALGRDFYDHQRTLHHPELTRNERLLSELEWPWFVQNMAPARKEMSQADSPRSAVTRTVLTAQREVAMGGRRQIIGAVKNDPASEEPEVENEPEERIETNDDSPAPIERVEYREPTQAPIVQGWARVATGRETCAWCLMLIARGAELNHKGNFAYAEAATAGLDLDDVTALDLWEEAGGDLKQFRELTGEHIDEWHAGCDCIAVPVFDVQNWPGRPAAIRAQELWIDADKEARRLISSGEARSKNKNREAQNALRRRLAAGEITIPSYAFGA